MWPLPPKTRRSTTVLAEGVILALREHLARVRLTHEEDLRAGCGAVYLPGALDRKYAGSGLSALNPQPLRPR
jgi:hypothetical protein